MSPFNAPSFKSPNKHEIEFLKQKNFCEQLGKIRPDIETYHRERYYFFYKEFKVKDDTAELTPEIVEEIEKRMEESEYKRMFHVSKDIIKRNAEEMNSLSNEIKKIKTDIDLIEDNFEEIKEGKKPFIFSATLEEKKDWEGSSGWYPWEDSGYSYEYTTGLFIADISKKADVKLELIDTVKSDTSSYYLSSRDSVISDYQKSGKIFVPPKELKLKTDLLLEGNGERKITSEQIKDLFLDLEDMKKKLADNIIVVENKIEKLEKSSEEYRKILEKYPADYQTREDR